MKADRRLRLSSSSGAGFGAYGRPRLMIAVRRLIGGCLHVTDEVQGLCSANEITRLTSGPVFEGVSGPVEVGVGPPKFVEQDGELAGDGDARAFGPLCGRQGLAPGLKSTGSLDPGEQDVRRFVQRRA